MEAEYNPKVGKKTQSISTVKCCEILKASEEENVPAP
jgi:hypothetical protein